MLTLHFNRRQLRHFACMTLFAWTFALLSGIVNACLVQPDWHGELGSLSSQAGPAAAGATLSATRQPQQVRQQSEDEGDGPGTDSAKAGCLKFCADESSAVTSCRCHSLASGRTACLYRAAAVHPLFAVDDLARSAKPSARAAAGPSSIGPSIGLSMVCRCRLATEQPALPPSFRVHTQDPQPIRSSP